MPIFLELNQFSMAPKFSIVLQYLILVEHYLSSIFIKEKIKNVVKGLILLEV